MRVLVVTQEEYEQGCDWSLHMAGVKETEHDDLGKDFVRPRAAQPVAAGAMR